MRRIRSAPDAPNVIAAAGRPDSGLGRTRLVLVALMLVVGLAAALIAWRQENRNTAAREVDTAEGVTASIRSTAENVIAGMSGAAGLVSSDGSLDTEGFEAFRRDVGEASSLTRLALIPVVASDERAEFEQRGGRAITDWGGEGFGPAEPRAVYWPVAHISPPEPLTALLLGVDVGEFPLTASVAREARDYGRTRITETVGLSASLIPPEELTAPLPDRPETDEYVVFFTLKPLYLPDLEETTVEARRRSHAGFVATVYDGESLVSGVRETVPERVRFVVRDSENVLARSAEAPEGGVERTVDIGGRTWFVTVQDPGQTRHPLTLLVLGITALVLGGLVYLIRRSDRYERDTARAALLISRTGELSQHLASAATVDDVAAAISRHVPRIFGARSASLGFVDSDAGTVHIHHSATVAPQISPRHPDRSLDEPGPITEAVRTGSLVVVKDHPDWWTYAAGAGVHENVAAETRAAAGLPLESTDGTIVAAIGILWSQRNAFDETTVATLRTVTELCEQSLHRADLTDQASLRAAHLAELAERLAGAATIEAAAAVITSLGREPVGALAASIGIVDREAGVLRVHHGETVSASLNEIYAEPPLDADLAFTEAARTGEAVLVGDWDSYVRRYPNTDAANAEVGRGARAALPLRDNDEVIGALVMSWSGPRAFEDSFISTLSTIAEMAAQTVQRARLSEHQVEDARHSRDLAQLAEGLAGRAHTEDITGFLAGGIVAPLDATHAVVGIVSDGMLTRHFSSPLPVGGVELTRNVERTPLDVSTPLTDAARTGEDVMMGSPAALRASYPLLAPAWEAVGFRATANLPLRDRTGRIFGSLGVAWDRPMDFSKELRDRLTTIVGIAAQTLERAQLVDLLRDTASRNEQLADFAQHVAQVRTVDDLCDTVAEHAAGPVEADVAILELVDEASHRLRVRPHARLGDVGIRFDGAPLYASLPGPEAIRSQIPVVLSSQAEVAARFPGALAGQMAEAGMEASVHLPITSPRGTPLGSIGFAWSTRQHFAGSSMATMRTIAELCAQTLERTRLGEAEHRLVSSLQNRVVTPLPHAPGLAIAQRYQPAARQVGMGGDWFDGIVLDDGRYALVVGDVAGHGITAVADMIQLRAIIEALVRARVDLGQVFPRASALLQRNPDGVTASACLAVFDPAGGTLSYISAGHPPPMLRSPDGAATILEGGRQALLGVTMSGGTPATVAFPPGSVFVAYTDGLIERREEPIDSSIERLRSSTEGSSSEDVEVVADDLVERCLEGRDPADDVALVVISRP